MWRRITQVLMAELLAFGAFVFGGLSLLGGVMTTMGDSQHPAHVSWLLVAAFASIAIALAKLAVGRLRLAFARSARTGA